MRYSVRLVLFQSTHPHGVRPSGVITGCRCVKFQSTHPHGVRPFNTDQSLLYQYFNPRTRTGCDVKNSLTLNERRKISIHAPARGATISRQTPGSLRPLFQSTHPHGVRREPRTRGEGSGPKFQSTHPHGVRREPRTRGEGSGPKFQSTHPHGVRLFSTVSGGKNK